MDFYINWRVLHFFPFSSTSHYFITSMFQFLWQSFLWRFYLARYTHDDRLHLKGIYVTSYNQRTTAFTLWSFIASNHALCRSNYILCSFCAYQKQINCTAIILIWISRFLLCTKESKIVCHSCFKQRVSNFMAFCVAVSTFLAHQP